MSIQLKNKIKQWAAVFLLLHTNEGSGETQTLRSWCCSHVPVALATHGAGGYQSLAYCMPVLILYCIYYKISSLESLFCLSDWPHCCMECFYYVSILIHVIWKMCPKSMSCNVRKFFKRNTLSGGPTVQIHQMTMNIHDAYTESTGGWETT